jgi:hypothetical protein
MVAPLDILDCTDLTCSTVHFHCGVMILDYAAKEAEVHYIVNVFILLLCRLFHHDVSNSYIIA